MRWVASRLRQRFSGRAAPPDAAHYWSERARRWGPRAVLDLRHDPAQVAEVTERQRREIFPHLREALDGSERTLVDFGCGTGRFTAELARLIGGRALGFDICAELLAAAPSDPAIAYARVGDAGLPLCSASADVVWVCLVLGGITEPRALDLAAAEILRVLAPGGLLFLVENTSELPSPSHWSYRPVAAYQELFAPLALRHCGDYRDLGETMSILAGRASR